MTERKIQDYLHFYLGCDCQIAVIVPGQELSWEPEKINIRWLHGALNKLVEVKPILRNLSDMTEEDVISWGDVTVSHTPYCVELDSKDDFGEFTEIYPDGSILSKSKDDGEMRPINGGELFRLLLSKGFDIFNLIPDGLAINKSTLKP